MPKFHWCDGGDFEVGVEGGHAKGRGVDLSRRREKVGRFAGGEGEFGGEALGVADVGDRAAAGGRGSADVGVAGEGEAGDAAGHGGDLEGGDGVEGHGVAGAEDGFASRGSRRWTRRGPMAARLLRLVPGVGLDEGDRALGAVNGVCSGT